MKRRNYKDTEHKNCNQTHSNYTLNNIDQFKPYMLNKARYNMIRDEENSEAVLIFLIISEHVLLMLKVITSWYISDTPFWVREFL